MSIPIVGFQGVAGSFSEEALINYFKEDKITKNYTQFEDVFTALSKGEIDYGVLPIENSSTGVISTVIDLLNDSDCYIVGETYVAVIQNLLAIKGATIDDIKEVYSHPQGFEQSTTFLSTHDWKLVPYYNTATSAKHVLTQNDKSIAAIASDRAAQIYDLNILASHINCNLQNTTKFVIIGKSLEVKPDSDKISIVMSTKHQAGALYGILKYFANNHINLLKIESRPIKHTPWEYYFYIDLEGNIHDDIVKQTLTTIESECNHYKLLGNYKRQM
jgi:chorismate mutase/prephenate dehydratase